MEFWIVGTALLLVVLYFVGMIVENHYYRKNQPPSRPATEQDLLDCMRALKHGQEPDPFERELIRLAIEKQNRRGN
jgi:hypothetical protein